jgi:hypothetical protein
MGERDLLAVADRVQLLVNAISDETDFPLQAPGRHFVNHQLCFRVLGPAMNIERSREGEGFSLFSVSRSGIGRHERAILGWLPLPMADR